MLGGSEEPFPAEKSFLVEQDGKFLSRILAKEASMADSSRRLSYYGGASGAVPFIWESQPGTPKHRSSETSMSRPPLTPPPSFQSRSKLASARKKKSRSRAAAFWSRIVSGLVRSKKADALPSPSLSSESSVLSSLPWSSSSSLSPSSEKQTMSVTSISPSPHSPPLRHWVFVQMNLEAAICPRQ